MRSRSAGIFTEPLTRGTIVNAIYGIGTVASNKIWRITPALATTVMQVWVKEGDSVKKGAKLIKDDEIIWHAPFAGTIASLSFKSGENTFNATPILTLIDMNDRYLVVSMEQQAALLVKPGQKVKISFDTRRAQSYEGKVVALYSNESNFLARISLSSIPLEILPGMTADTAIEIARHNESLLGFTAALENGKEVWRKRGREIPKKIQITVGFVDKDRFEIIAGDIQEGDRLLIRKDLSK